MPRRRTAAAVPGASASAQSLLRAVFGRRAAVEQKDGGDGRDEGDPVQFPSRFTRRLQLDDDEDEEEDGVDDEDEGENKSRLISQVRAAYSFNYLSIKML